MRALWRKRNHGTVDSPLRRKRLALRLSQKALANLCGIDTGTISRLERGELKSPHGAHLLCLMRVLELPAEAFIDPQQYLVDHPDFYPDRADATKRKPGRPRKSP